MSSDLVRRLLKQLHFKLLLPFACALGSISSSAQQNAPAPPSFVLTSTSFSDTQTIPSAFTCSAGDAVRSPALTWTGVPSGTSSLVLYMHDLDPRPNKGSDDILHWVVWNIPPDAKGFSENIKAEVVTLPDGAKQGLNQRGKAGFLGPCPPVGAAAHHYVFDLYALDTKLDIPDSSSRHDLTKAMDGHVLAHSVLVGLFSRK